MPEKKLTGAEMRRLNRSRVFRLIYEEGRVTKQEIARKLQMSLPTVAQNLRELEGMRLIERNGQFESTGGRKPQAIVCVGGAKVALGIFVTKHHLRFVAVGLYGRVIRQDTVREPYRNDPAYYRRVGELLGIFLDSLRISPRRVLGVGVAMQGLVSPDGRTMVYGEILGCTGVTSEDFGRWMGFPCRLIHDSEAAASAELWADKGITDAFYLALNQNLGGAVIIGGAIHKGQNLRSGMLEHICLVPGGKPCYCGRRGCFEAYCSVNSLLEGGPETLEEFFRDLRGGKQAARDRWEEYLEYLASAVNNLRMTVDCEVILGGQAAAFLEERDLDQLYALLRERASFPMERPFLKIGRLKSEAPAVGAALTYIMDFLKNI